VILNREPFPEAWEPRPPLPKPREPRPLPEYKPSKPAKPSFLFIRSANLDPASEDLVQTYLLRCPQCARTAFTSLQGLLNHARITHGLQWGTHDDCVRACAVLDPELDTNAGLEVGLGPHGLLPGLQSLFKMAVAVGGSYAPDTLETSASTESGVPSGSHLARTLGLHKDSPALASFLGKEAPRRRIQVKEDEPVDVNTVNTRVASWRMRYSHRSSRQSSDIHQPENSVHLNPLEGFSPLAAQESSVASQGSQGPAHSRFHFSTRITISDRSLWLPSGTFNPLDMCII
jgi:hypothetical protein